MAKIAGLPPGPKSTDYVNICRRNGWSLNDLARKLGYEHFGQAQRKINALRSLGQCIECGNVSDFRDPRRYVCSEECRKSRARTYAGLNFKQSVRKQVKKPAIEAPKVPDEPRTSGYAARLRNIPLFRAEIKRE